MEEELMFYYMEGVVNNLVREVNHLMDFLKDKDENYIRSNPVKVANELVSTGLAVHYDIGAYDYLDYIRMNGDPPVTKFRES